MQVVIYSGIGLSIVPAILLLFFDDGKFIREEEQHGTGSPAPKPNAGAGTVHVSAARDLACKLLSLIF